MPKIESPDRNLVSMVTIVSILRWFIFFRVLTVGLHSKIKSLVPIYERQTKWIFEILYIAKSNDIIFGAMVVVVSLLRSLKHEKHCKIENCHQDSLLRGAWSDRDTNDIFAHCSLIFYYLDFKFSNFVCPSELHPLIWFFLKNSFRKKKNIRKTSQNALAPSIFIVWSIVLKLGTPLLHIQAQNTLLQNF